MDAEERGQPRHFIIFDEYAVWDRNTNEEETMETLGDFGWALECLRSGLKVQRSGWNGPGQFLQLQVPDEHSKMTLPYIYITTVSGDRVPWLASQTDLLANDWQTV